MHRPSARLSIQLVTHQVCTQILTGGRIIWIMVCYHRTKSGLQDIIHPSQVVDISGMVDVIIGSILRPAMWAESAEQ